MEEMTPYEIASKKIAGAARSGTTWLDLSYLKLTTLPAEISQLSFLTSLDLSNNQFTSFPTEVFKLISLTSLTLSGNQLTFLPVEIGRLDKLISLNLSNNRLTSLPAEVGQLVNLNSLDLHDNELISLPEEIGQLVKLNFLFLSQNKLSLLPLTIKQLVNLAILNLFQNKVNSLIEVSQLVNLTSLNLSKNDLKSLPEDIGQLVNLISLDLSDNQLTSLPTEISQLVNLNSLNLANNRLSYFPDEIQEITNLTSLDLFGNGFHSIPVEINQLTKLTNLNLAWNHLVSLPEEMWNLVNLVTLSLSGNWLTILPNNIGQLTNLSLLDLSNNKISILPVEIGRLKNLKSLYLLDNNLSLLPNEIGDLTALEELDLSNQILFASSGNSIKKLPAEIQKLKNLRNLDLVNTTLPIPPEILRKAEEPQAILRYYFSHLKKELNECKVLVVGQGNVGKTSLVKYLVLGDFNLLETKTEGIAITQWKIEYGQSKTESDQSKINLNIWDFGGQEIMHATHQFFLTKRSLYILVLDSRLSQEENRVEYWLKIIQSFGGDSPVLLVGNKTDQHPLDIDRSGLKKKYPNIVGIFETSAATGAGMDLLRSTIAEQIHNLPHVRDMLPESWFMVKKRLEELGRSNNFIRHDEFLSLCSKNEVGEESSQRTLIGFMHDLGVVLHFQDDPRLESLGILNPQWVTNGVYKILNSHTLFKNKGVLTTSMLDEILNLPEYPRGKRLFIVDMMKKFELCYDIEPDKTFLVPDLLPKDEPSELNFKGIPAFEYAYPVLPSSVITRFIVRMNQKIKNHFVWRTGVVLKIGENTALVKADIEDSKINIVIDGQEYTRRDTLSAIRYQLDEIHGSIKGLNPEKYVPVPGAVNTKPLKYEYLLKLERAGKETLDVEDGVGLKEINIAQMLNGVESEYQRKQYGNVINISGNVTDSTIIAGDENEVKK